MRISDIDIKKAFEECLIDNGMTNIAIYKAGVPTANRPEKFIDLKQNGSIKTSASRLGTFSAVLLVSINTKLLKTGERNLVSESIIMDSICDMFNENKVVVNGEYHFILDLNNLVYDGISITENYSTKIINIKVSIY